MGGWNISWLKQFQAENSNGAPNKSCGKIMVEITISQTNSPGSEGLSPLASCRMRDSTPISQKIASIQLHKARTNNCPSSKKKQLVIIFGPQFWWYKIPSFLRKMSWCWKGFFIAEHRLQMILSPWFFGATSPVFELIKVAQNRLNEEKCWGTFQNERRNLLSASWSNKNSIFLERKMLSFLGDGNWDVENAFLAHRINPKEFQQKTSNQHLLS